MPHAARESDRVVVPIRSLLGSWSPSSAHSVHLENSEPCSLILPFLESRSSQKVQNTKKTFFEKLELAPKEGNFLENPRKHYKT
jgi:hypothetical protein